MSGVLEDMKQFCGPCLSEPDREWFCYLTVENAEHVAEHLRLILGGNEYVWAEMNDGLPGLGLRVDTGRRLTPATNDPSGVTCHLGDDHAHITVCDTYGVWGLTSGLLVQPPMMASDEDLDEDVAQARKWATAISWGRSASLQTRAYHFELRVPAGHRTRWTVAATGPVAAAERTGS